MRVGYGLRGVISPCVPSRRPCRPENDRPNVDKVLDHRPHPVHGLEFLVHWTGRDQDFLAWEPAGGFLGGCPDPWLGYCYEKGLVLDLPRAVESIGKNPPLVPDDPEDEE